MKSAQTEPQIKWPICYLFDRGCSIMLKRVNKIVSNTYGVNDYTDMLILMCAARANYNQRQMAEFLAVPQNAMGRRVNHLEDSGYLRRDSHDDRQYILTPTSKGYEAARSWEKQLDRLTQSSVSPLTINEVDALYALLFKIVEEEQCLTRPNAP